MSRKYLSGSEKRKLAAKKQEEQNEVMKKVPKIIDIFAAIGSASTSNSSATESVNDEIESQLGSHDENVMNCVESMEIEAETIEIGRTFEFPADAALWIIEDNITSLQNYWISKGNVK